MSTTNTNSCTCPEYDYFTSSHTAQQIEDAIWIARNYADSIEGFNNQQNYIGNIETKVDELETRVIALEEGAGDGSGEGDGTGGGTGVNVSLSQGYIHKGTIDDVLTTRVKINGLIAGPFSIVCNEGFVIRAIEECLSTTPSASDIDVVTAEQNLSEYEGGSTGKYYTATFCKTDPNADISPSDSVLQSFTGVIVPIGSNSIGGTVIERITALEDIVSPANYDLEEKGTIPERFTAIERGLQACSVNGRKYDPNLTGPTKKEGSNRHLYYQNGYSKVLAYRHITDEASYYYKDGENYIEITTDADDPNYSNYYYYYTLPFYKPTLQHTGASAEHNSSTSKITDNFYKINTSIDTNNNITDTNFSITINEAGLYQVSGSVYMDGRTSEGRYCKAYILYKENDNSNDFSKSPHLDANSGWTFDGYMTQIDNVLYKKEGDNYTSIGQPYARELTAGSATIEGAGAIAIPPKIVYLKEGSELFLAAKGANDSNGGNIVYPGNPATYLTLLKIT